MSSNPLISQIVADQPCELLVQLLKQSSLINRPMLEGVAIPNGVSINELKIMIGLRGEDTLAGHDITDIFGMSPMNVTRSLASLRERGWIEDVRDPNNKKRRPVQLSDDGSKACQQIIRNMAGVSSFILGGLTADEHVALIHITGKIVARIDAWSASAND